MRSWLIQIEVTASSQAISVSTPFIICQLHGLIFAICVVSVLFNKFKSLKYFLIN